MKKTQFIPDMVKFRVRNQSHKDLPTAVPFPSSSVPKVQSLITKAVGTYGDICIQNTPTKGYHAMLFGEELELCHPDGYAIEVTTYNLGIIIREGNLNNGYIEDELVFVFDNTFCEFFLVPYGKATYNEIKKQSDEFFAAKSGSTKLESGCNVVYDGCEFTYLGEMYYASANYNRYKYVMDLVITKRMVLKDKDGYYIMPQRKPDGITPGTVPGVTIDELKDICTTKEMKYIKKFNKNGYFNDHPYKDIHVVSTTKITKKDLVLKYISTNETTIYDFPLFRATDGELYLKVENTRWGNRNYAVEWLMRNAVGDSVLGVPFIEDTLKADVTFDDYKITFNNVQKVNVQEILHPVLEIK